jgi:hypothetical protein
MYDARLMMLHEWSVLLLPVNTPTRVDNLPGMKKWDDQAGG